MPADTRVFWTARRSHRSSLTRKGSSPLPAGRHATNHQSVVADRVAQRNLPRKNSLAARLSAHRSRASAKLNLPRLQPPPDQRKPPPGGGGVCPFQIRDGKSRATKKEGDAGVLPNFCRPGQPRCEHPVQFFTEFRLRLHCSFVEPEVDDSGTAGAAEERLQPNTAGR